MAINPTPSISTVGRGFLWIQSDKEEKVTIPDGSDLWNLPVKLSGNSVRYIKSQLGDELRKKLTCGDPEKRSPHISKVHFTSSLNDFVCQQYALGKIFDPENPEAGAIFEVQHKRLGTLKTPMTRARTHRLIKKYFRPTLDPHEGDLVVYSDKHQNPLHFGIYKGQGRVESKWGKLGVYEHPLFEVCHSYGQVATFFHSGNCPDPSSLKKRILSELETLDDHSLLDLIRHNAHSQIKEHLRIRPKDCNLLGLQDHSPLLTASLHGQLDIAQTLLEAQADVNLCENEYGFGPLTAAAQENHTEIVHLLIKYGASTEHTTEAGLTPLHVAATQGKPEAMIALIQNGANFETLSQVGLTPMHCAAKKGHLACMKILLEIGTSTNIQSDNGKTPLGISVDTKNDEMIQLIMAEGDDCSTLVLASERGRLDAVTTLLNANYDINTSLEPHGLFALGQATGHNHPPIMKKLLDHGAAVNQTNKYGTSSLHLAAAYGLEQALVILLKAKAALDAKDETGNSPLLYAVQQDHLTCAKLLTEAGASINLCNNDGDSPLKLAQSKGNKRMIQLFVNSGAQKKASFPKELL